MSQEIPEHILTAAKDLCEYMPPNALAELVDYWSNEPDYLPLAQIAFDAGWRNCGAQDLARYINKKDPAKVLRQWNEAGADKLVLNYDN
jgi:GH24 family phage-related lysozyme (muramidase)